MKKSIISALILSSSTLFASFIKPNDANITIAGSMYVQKSDQLVHIERFRKDILAMKAKKLGLNPKNASNTSGVTIAFMTDSRHIKAGFKVSGTSWIGAGFSIYINNKPTKDFRYTKRKINGEGGDITFEFENDTDSMAKIEIVLPSFYQAEFTGLEIDDNAVIKKAEIPSKIYVALGDSITHGMGQDGFTSKTWPYLLSRKLNAQLFNLAVGGGKIAVPVGKMLEDWKKIDYITILIGYNDLHFDRKTPEIYRNKYNEWLDVIRRNHPESKIFCITPLFTKKPVSEKTGVSLEAFRKVVADIVSRRSATDKNIFLVHGEKITSVENLRKNTKDPVHMSVKGAKMFADAVYKEIKDEL